MAWPGRAEERGRWSVCGGLASCGHGSWAQSACMAGSSVLGCNERRPGIGLEVELPASESVCTHHACVCARGGHLVRRRGCAPHRRHREKRIYGLCLGAAEPYAAVDPRGDPTRHSNGNAHCTEAQQPLPPQPQLLPACSSNCVREGGKEGLRAAMRRTSTYFCTC